MLTKLKPKFIQTIDTNKSAIANYKKTQLCIFNCNSYNEFRELMSHS